jgi:hypothetical protein
MPDLSINNDAWLSMLRSHLDTECYGGRDLRRPSVTLIRSTLSKRFCRTACRARLGLQSAGTPVVGSRRTRTNSALRYLVIIGWATLGASQEAKADVVKFNGVLISDGSAVGSGDPVIANPATINVGDPFSILRNYDPASFTLSGGSYVLTNATFTLTFDTYSFPYASAAGNYIEFSTPGAFWSGTTSFLICSSFPAASRTISSISTSRET